MYISPPDSAVCNAERQLILVEYKPAPPRSRPLRRRVLRPGRPCPSPPLQPDSAPHRAPAQNEGGAERGGGEGAGWGLEREECVVEGKEGIVKMKTNN